MWRLTWQWRLLRQLNRIIANQETIMSALDDLTAEVTLDVAAIEAAIARIGAGSSDAAQLAALTAQLAAARTALDAALTPPSS